MGLILFDRDGTLILNVPYNGDPALVHPVNGAREALSLARAAGFKVGIITNQSGVARGLLTMSAVKAVNDRVIELLGPFDIVLVCPHSSEDQCECRKPGSALIDQACKELNVPSTQCCVVGDIGTDMMAAINARVRGILVPNAATRREEIEDALLHPQLQVSQDLLSAVRIAIGPVGIAQQHVADLLSAVSGSAAALERARGWGEQLVDVFRRGNKILIAGNGGSAAEAAHLAAELVGRYSMMRRGLAAIALPGDMASVTAIANDFGINDVFTRPIEALCREGDVVLLMSTSGRSSNILAAARAAHNSGARVWAMTGKTPNPLSGLADDVLSIAAESTAIIQEVHLAAVHVIAQSVDEALESTKPAHVIDLTQVPV